MLIVTSFYALMSSEELTDETIVVFGWGQFCIPIDGDPDQCVVADRWW